MSLSLLLDQSQVNRGLAPREHRHTTTGDIFSASIGYMRDNFNVEASWRLHREQLVDRTQKYYDLIGEDYQFHDGVVSGHAGEAKSQQEQIDAAIMAGREGPEADKWQGIMTTEEAREAARNKAKASKQEFEDTLAHAEPGAWATTAKFGGMFAGGMTDWLNLATLPIGFGLGKNIWQVAKINAAANMTIEGLSQPSVMAWQEELKQEYGISYLMPN
jgi:hypothetical protein